ncbi:MAG: cytochrome c-type biogenesis protein [Pseudotabrizicola sp.]|uniref:cytochrome c-type biogenesis protein n=1 Tax=Pseudotabrizicola sp. TaxID=2939647 RepID=UPI00271FB87D|nr:cytochrome c-type biogenesis protein [Pseudotabrizicola sp.]MDO8882353.1 cytochrome c-type biogenesis protein CcmH [Pseudotabrizicola sp.]MDP2080327.1 cytochrome c-type biogenesis protein CcmH [Pseudotabrizicola sp.]MDZ7572350.1 cytochrome c-type biogenesis protein [Pseudotabrizicola sp.]
MKRMALALLLAFAPLSPVFAVQPDEVLADAGLEARARAISRNLRCPVCQGESIDDSNAPISRDLRLVVRERIMAGDTDAQVVDFVVSRYGEFVLFSPKAEGANLILWLAGPGLLLVGGIGAFAYIRKRGRGVVPAEALSADEQSRLRDLLEK